MQICDACRGLVGKSSDEAPHDQLKRSGIGLQVGVDTPDRRQEKLHDRWICAECGTWMYQCTEHEIDTPNKWRSGPRPADWPAGLPTV